jgi:hypothetical protein
VEKSTAMYYNHGASYTSTPPSTRHSRYGTKTWALGKYDGTIRVTGASFSDKEITAERRRANAVNPVDKANSFQSREERSTHNLNSDTRELSKFLHVYDRKRNDVSRANDEEVVRTTGTDLLKPLTENGSRSSPGDVDVMGVPRPDPHKPALPLPKGRLYHFNIIYNHAQSPLSITADIERSLAWTKRAVEKLELQGVVNSYYHDRDCQPGQGLTHELARVIQASQVTLLLLSPGFVKDCWPRYWTLACFRELFADTPPASSSAPSSSSSVFSSHHSSLSSSPAEHTSWDEVVAEGRESSAVSSMRSSSTSGYGSAASATSTKASTRPSRFLHSRFSASCPLPERHGLNSHSSSFSPTQTFLYCDYTSNSDAIACSWHKKRDEVEVYKDCLPNIVTSSGWKRIGNRDGSGLDDYSSVTHQWGKRAGKHNNNGYNDYTTTSSASTTNAKHKHLSKHTRQNDNICKTKVVLVALDLSHEDLPDILRTKDVQFISSDSTEDITAWEKLEGEITTALPPSHSIHSLASLDQDDLYCVDHDERCLEEGSLAHHSPKTEDRSQNDLPAADSFSEKDGGWKSLRNDDRCSDFENSPTDCGRLDRNGLQRNMLDADIEESPDVDDYDCLQEYDPFHRLDRWRIAQDSTRKDKGFTALSGEDDELEDLLLLSHSYGCAGKFLCQ